MNRKSVQRFLLKLFVTEDLGSFCGFFSMCIYVKQFPTRVKACEADSPSGQKVGESRQWHQPCSQQQFSAKSSTLLTFSSEGSPRQIKRGRGKSQQEREGAEKKNTSQGFLTSLGLISSSSFPHFVLHGCVLNFFSSCRLVCVFSVLEVASPSQVSLETAGRVHTRGTEWEGMCRVKVNDCSGLWLLPLSTRQTQLISSAWVKKPHPLIATRTTLCSAFSYTLLDWVCLCIQALLTLPPPAMFHPPSSLHKPWRRGGN